MPRRLFSTRRVGSASQAVIYAVASLAVIGVLSWLLLGMGDEEETPDEIVLYCAAGIKKPVAEAVKQYQEEEFGVPVRIVYGGSGELLTKLQVEKRGDLYLAADVSYMEIAQDKGILDETIPLAVQRPVIAVKKGNPKNIASIKDLLKPDVTFALAEPDSASVGKLTKKILTKTGEWDAIKEKCRVFKGTVNEISADVIIGEVDAAIVWDANVSQLSDKLDMVRTKEFDAAKKTITIGVLKWTTSSAKALQLARYLQAPEKGQQAFKQYGYELLPDADAWAERPVLSLFSGGVNRVAIDKTLKEFEQREGVKVNVVYNGCGILVSQMKGGERPDAYFACDTSFMVQVQDQFHPSQDISETDMVIVVLKENPQKIASLADLARPGMRVGLADPEKSALGELTEKLLNSLGLLERVKKNRKVSSATADILVNQLKGGDDLDAVIVYRANVSQIKDSVTVIDIKEGKPKAVQPIAIGKESRYPYLMRRLVSTLRSEHSRERFQSADFRWVE